jgi:hypothetical protein
MRKPDLPDEAARSLLLEGIWLSAELAKISVRLRSLKKLDVLERFASSTQS